MAGKSSFSYWDTLGADPRTFTTAEEFNAISRGHLPELAGIEVTLCDKERFTGRMAVRPEIMAPNGFIHAASVIALADTLAGYATMINLQEGAESFTTVELKSNFLGTVREGAVSAVAIPQHRGRTTQVWDVDVHDEATDKRIAMFRCTQAVLWPR